MKIVYVLTRRAPIGGAQVHVRDLSSAMSELGHEVLVLTGSEHLDGSRFASDLKARGVELDYVPSLEQRLGLRRDLLAFRALRARLSLERPTLVSLHSSKAGVIGRASASALGLPSVFTAHGWAFADGVPPNRAILYRAIERRMARVSSHIIAVSEADRKLAIDLKVAQPQSITTVHNGMPDIPISLVARPQHVPVSIVMVARFQAQKDHFTALSALSKLRHFDWTLDLIGDGPLREMIGRLAGDLGIASRVRFCGETSSVADHLSQAQIFLLSSNWEGFPRSILEAMRAGLPVVASDVGGVREAVVDGQTGYLVARGDTVSMTDRLSELVSNADLRAQFGSAARHRFMQHFAFSQMLRKTLRVYEKVLSVSSFQEREAAPSGE